MHFSYNGDIYTLVDGVAVYSPLGPVLGSIFMVELERTISPTLKKAYESMEKVCGSHHLLYKRRIY